MRLLRTMLVSMLTLASLVIGGSVVAAQPLQPAPTSAMHISAFYSITGAAYKAWTTKSPAPASTRAFSTGTTDVGYYIHYHDVVPHRTIYQVMIYDQTGAAYATGNTHTFSYDSGDLLNSFGGGGPFDDGSYRMDLLLNSVVAASSTFTVGTATVHAAQISTQQMIGKRINKFYAITLAAYKSWTTRSSTPAPTQSFPKGTTDVGYYIAYQGMAAKHTSFQVVIYDQTGASYVTGSIHTFPYVRGEQLSYFGGGTPFDRGTYRMDVIVNGVVAGSAKFTVGV